METRTRDLLFGAGRGTDGMRGVFAPRTDGTAVGWRDLIGTYRGPGAQRGLDALERRGIIGAEQRLGDAAAGATELLDSAGPTRGLAGAASATAGQVEYANPIYNGLWAQAIMREQGFVAPIARPDGVVLGGDDVRLATTPAAEAAPAAADATTVAASSADAPIAAAADDAAAQVAALEQRMSAGFRRLGELPLDAKVPALARAVDDTAAHGGDAMRVLGRTLASRPLDDAVPAFERALDDAAKVVVPAIDDAVKAAPAAAKVVEAVAPKAAPVIEQVATEAAPVVDDVAEAVAKAIPGALEAVVPKLAETMAPKVAEALAPKLLLAGSDDVLRAGMTFSQGVDDTLRLLARF